MTAMTTVKTAALLSALSLAGCGADQQEASDMMTLGGTGGMMIVGGVNVGATDIVTKSTVSLLQPDGWQFCTGSLIDSTHVLTAAHCVVDYTDSKMFVGFGVNSATSFKTPTSLVLVKKYVHHESYNTKAMDSIGTPTTPPNDIALITLSKPAPAGYTPNSMLAMNEKVTIGETLTLAGFGLTSPNGTSGILRKVDTKLTEASAVAKEITFGKSPGKSACMGDSGGPAFVKRGSRLVQIGVTSRGASKCNKDGIYTDVRYFQPWIQSKK